MKYINDFKGNFFEKMLDIILIVILALVCISIVRIIFNKLQEKNPNKLTKTILQVIKKTITYILVFIAMMLILGLFGIDTVSIFATAGIGTLILGLGAQSFVKDLINGFFILVEQQFVVGDFVQIGDIKGYIDEIGFRTTIIKSETSGINYISNGQINKVTNFSRIPKKAIVNIHIDKKNDIKKVFEEIENIKPEISKEKKEIILNAIEGPFIMSTTDYSYVICLRCLVRPMWSYDMESYMNKKILEHLQQKSIIEVKGE